MMNLHSMKWSFKSSEETNEGRVHRIAIYLQSKVMEMIDSNGSAFYLVYFKGILLGGGSLEQISPQTFLHEAFEKGMTFSASHPLFPVMLPKTHHAVLPDLQDLFTRLQDHLSLQEIAVAATFMDSFADKTEIYRIVREIFNHFRRNGQFFKAYQVAKILLDFSPEVKSTKGLIQTPEFAKYRKLDQLTPMALLQKDPLMLERFYYTNLLRQPNAERQLHQMLKEQSRHQERLALFIHIFEMKNDFYDYEAFSQLMYSQVQPDDRRAILKYLCESFPPFLPLTEEWLQEQVRLDQFPEALSTIMTQIPHPSASHYQMIETFMDHIEPPSLVRMKGINRIISHLYPHHENKKEELVRRLAACLLEQEDPSQVKSWLEPIRHENPKLPVFEQIDELDFLYSDFNHLTKLGEGYYQFGLLDQSIEYFSMEMELNPDSIDPILWLSKLYEEKGMREEASGYKKLSVFMAKTRDK